MTEIFPIIPSTSRPIWLIALVGVVVLSTLFILGASFAGARNARFEISPQGLRLRGDMYGRLIPVRLLHIDAAKALDLQIDQAFAPASRTMGTAFPGYRAGWFRLRNGEKALVYVTDPTSVVYVPTYDGYAVLLSVQDPQAFLTSLRRIGATP